MPTLNEAAPEELMRMITSENFILIPSNSNTAFKIPKALLSSVSKPFGASAEGGWVETSNGSHKFLVQDENRSEADVTEQVLTCFIKWAFTGQYSTEDVGISSPVEQITKVEEPAGWGSSNAGRSTWNFGVPAVEYPADPPAEPEPEEGPFDESPAEAEVPHTEEDILTEQARRAQTKQGSKVSSDSGEASGEPATKIDPLFLHIQIYVFANIYQVQDLKDTSMKNLKACLKNIENSGDNHTSDIFDMLDYAFLHLPDGDKLLNRLAKYAAWRLETLREDYARLDVLLRASDGKFSSMLVRRVGPAKVNPFKGKVSML